MNKKILFLLFFISFTIKIDSQNIVNFEEKIFVHYNSSNFLVGETIYFKMYNLNSSTNELSDLSKIGYIEIIDESKKSIIKHKVLFKKGLASGDIFLPVDTKTGIYKLVAYSSFMENQPVSKYFIEDITIINPYQSILSDNITEKSILKIENKNQITNKYLDVTLNKKNFSKREKVELSIVKKPEYLNSNLSISVKKNDSINQNNILISTNNSSQTNEFISNNNYIIPEIRGEIISGKLISKGNFPVDNKTVALSVAGMNFDFKIVHTNKKGEFNFILDNYPNKEELTIQVLEDDRYNYSIEILKNEKDYSSLVFNKKIEISPEIKKLIEKRSIANQIENSYFTLKKDTIKDDIIKKPFYYPLAKTISLDDYTRFPKLKETIIEILPQVYFKEKLGNYSINLINKKLNEGENGTTLVLIDGLLVQNVKELFEFDTRNIDRIDIITDKYVYGPKIFNGIINFITKEFNYELKESGDYILKTQLQRPLTKKYYYNQDYSDPSKYERIPDYRYQLLWNPDLIIENEKTISFYTSDIKGQFEISIEGFTSDGKPISIKEYFEVK
jgi:hypothetical protein